MLRVAGYAQVPSPLNLQPGLAAQRHSDPGAAAPPDMLEPADVTLSGDLEAPEPAPAVGARDVRQQPRVLGRDGPGGGPRRGGAEVRGRERLQTELRSAAATAAAAAARWVVVSLCRSHWSAKLLQAECLALDA